MLGCLASVLLLAFLISCSGAKYQALFVDWDETVIETFELNSRDVSPVIDLVIKPSRVGHDFDKWEISIDENSKTIMIKATYKIKTFTVTWRHEDGSILEIDENVPWGSIPTFDGEYPISSSPLEYVYVGWDRYIDFVTNVVVYTVIREYEEYTVEFVNWDGKLLQSYNWRYNAPIIPPEDPTREGYYFIGWDTDDFIGKGEKQLLLYILR
jgi:hypothetical protein